MKKKNEAYQSPIKQSQSKSLKQEFIYEVLGAEEAFKKFRNKQNLTKLISMYRKLVEFYSQKNDKITLYFTQKIAACSSQMPSLQESDEKLTMSMVKENADEDPSEQDARFKTIASTPASYDPEIKKKQRSKNAQIAIEVNKVKKRANAKTILTNYYDECIENNKIVVEDLKNQRKQLQDKLMEIRNYGNMQIREAQKQYRNRWSSEAMRCTWDTHQHSMIADKVRMN